MPTSLARRLALVITAAAGSGALLAAGPAATPLATAPVRPALPAQAAHRLAPVQGFPGSDAMEAQTAAEQLAQPRGLVPPAAYRQAFAAMQGLATTGGAWNEITKVAYDSDDLRYRDPSGNSTGGLGIVSGRVVALAAGADGAIYAGSANGGVFRSASGTGSDWRAISDSLPSLSVGDLAVKPGSNEVWLATGEANTGGTSYAGDGVYRWVAGSWSQVGGTDLSGTSINKLHFDGAGWVYAATSRGLWRISDSGTGTWARVLVLNQAALDAPHTSNAPYANIVNDVITRPGRTGVLVAAGWRSSTDNSYYGNGFYYSPTGAVGSFQRINPSGAINPKEIGNTTFAYSADGSRLYAVVQSTVLIAQSTGTRAASTVLAGVFVSKSGSLEGPWSRIADSTNLSNRGSALKASIGGKGYGPGVQAWYNQFLAVDPTDPLHVYLGLEEVYETRDGGGSWTAAGPYWNFYFPCWSADPARNTCPTTTHPDQHDVLFAGSTLFVANDGGVYSRPAASRKLNANGNATDWTSLNATLRSLQYYAAAVGTDPNGGVILSGGLQDNGGSILRGVMPDGSTTDRGDSVAYPAHAGFPGSTTQTTGVMGSNFGGDGGDVIVNPRNGCEIVQEYVFLAMSKTTNCGESDGTVASTVPIAPLDAAPRFIAPMEADSTNTDHWVAAGNSVWTYANGFAIESGRDWVNAFDLGLGADGRYNSTTALASANDVIYAGYCSQCNNRGFTRGLARVQKVNGTWVGTKVAATGLPNRFLSGVWVDPANGQHVAVAVNGFNRRFTAGPEGLGHLFESTDGGESFIDVGGNLPDVPADDVVLADGGTTAYVATDLGVVKGTRSASTGAFQFKRLGTNLPATTVMDLSVGIDGVLYAATHSRGVWGYPLTTGTTTTTTGAGRTTKK